MTKINAYMDEQKHTLKQHLKIWEEMPEPYCEVPSNKEIKDEVNIPLFDIIGHILQLTKVFHLRLGPQHDGINSPTGRQSKGI
jgi:hypothetical protein